MPDDFALDKIMRIHRELECSHTLHLTTYAFFIITAFNLSFSNFLGVSQIGLLYSIEVILSHFIRRNIVKNFHDDERSSSSSSLLQIDYVQSTLCPYDTICVTTSPMTG